MSQQTTDKAQHFYRASAAEFMMIPGSPVAYDASKIVVKAFSYGLLAEDFVSDGALKTGDNSKYIRFHWEISADDRSSDGAWRDHPKGGDFRKWSGNRECVVKWTSDAINHYQNDFIARILDKKYWDLEGISWSAITSGYPSFRKLNKADIANNAALCIFPKNKDDLYIHLAYLNSKLGFHFLKFRTQTLNFLVGDVMGIPKNKLRNSTVVTNSIKCIELSDLDWNSFETSWDFKINPMVINNCVPITLSKVYKTVRDVWSKNVSDMLSFEEFSNQIFIDTYSLQDELKPEVKISNISLKCNPHYRYGGNRSEEEQETLLQCDTIKELLSYNIGCMVGRYSIDKPGLILASQGETLQDYLNLIPNPRFMPDSDAILPLTDQEWFVDDVTNRVREFVKVVWGEESLTENLSFIAESLCLHAIKERKSESALDTIRRYLSTQFYKDHLKTYKKRPIYWLFSSGKEKAFECLVYLHRYNESTLARMRTEYVTPLMGKYDAEHGRLQEQKLDATPNQLRDIEKQLKDLEKKQVELRAFDEQLKHHADMRIKLDLDDGVKVNYGKFGNLLAEVKAITGEKAD